MYSEGECCGGVGEAHDGSQEGNPTQRVEVLQQAEEQLDHSEDADPGTYTDTITT